MAVFLVNQCTFSKLPNINNDQTSPIANNQATTTTATTTTISNGVCCQTQLNSNDGTNNGTNLGSQNGVGLAPSNICGLKFDSLFELIHHIEDNHITDVDYPGITGPFYNNGHHHPHPSQQPGAHHLPTHQQQAHGMMAAPTIRDSNIYNVIPHDRHHMTQIINGGWLPTSCILRIFNSTHKPQHKQQQQMLPNQPPTHQLMHKLQASQHHLQQAIQGPPHPPQLQQPQQQANPQTVQAQPGQPQQPLPPPHQQLQPQPSPQPQIKYETGVVMSQSQDLQPQTTNSVIAPIGATHMQPPMGTLVQAQLQPQQCMHPQQNMHPQQMIVQLSQAPTMQQMPNVQQQQQQPQPTQIITSNGPQMTQTISNSIQTQQQTTIASPTTPISTTPKPTQVFKCTDCSKTYKTIHGLRTHQTAHHPNTHPPADGKMMALMPEGGDNTSSGSPAPIYQSQQQTTISAPATPIAPITTQKPTKVFKCSDCSKTYKTVHGLRTHQTAHHPNSPHTEGKIMAIMPEGGDNTSSGSPAPIYQPQPQPQAQPQPQPQQQQQLQPQQQQHEA